MSCLLKRFTELKDRFCKRASAFLHAVSDRSGNSTYNTEDQEIRSSELQNSIDADIEADRVNRIIGYRFKATGIFGYTFYTNNGKICSVSSIVGFSMPVMIYGNGVTWRSDYNNDRTLYPGVTRSINDESNGEQLFRIVFINKGEFEINESITVKCGSEDYTFYCDDKVIAKINRFSGDSGNIQKPSETGYEYEPYLEIAADKETATELLLVILAFPMLRFAF